MAAATKSADLHRMVTAEHVCPFGLKSRALLWREGYVVRDHLLRTRAATDAFMARHRVDTTPQTFIDGVRIGGYDDLRRHFGRRVRDPGAPTYRPVIAVFVVAALLACATLTMAPAVTPPMIATRFIALAMCLLALQKLRDLEAFTNTFLTYDLLARRVVGYAYVFPFAELAAGLLMVAGALPRVSGPIALAIGGVGAVSVFKAVYLERRELSCGCVGGGSNVPLGFVSLLEYVLMVAMGAAAVAGVLY